MQKINVAGLKIDALAKSELLNELKKRILQPSSFAKATEDDPLLNKNNVGQTWVTTVYSEFLYAALRDPGVMQMLNEADISVPDGIGIFWAKKFLSIPLAAKSYYGKIFQALWQVKYSLAAIIFNPNWIKSAFPEKIPGSELIWDLVKMAEENNLSIYLLGGFGNTSELVAKKISVPLVHGRELREQLKIAGYSSKNPSDISIIEDIKKASPDLLFVAYGPIKQEAWIHANLKNLPVKLAIGLGGTFDYLAEKRLNPPKFVRKIGLEWLFRLFTQPRRIKRIWQATFGLIVMLMRYKVFNSYPLRPNVAVIILNKQNQVLVCERSPKDFYIDIINEQERLKTFGYWQLPQGGIDAAENLESAAKREAAEETGLQNLQLVKISEKTNIYFWNNALRKFWKNRKHKNAGQKQSLIYFKFLGNSNEIQMDQKEFINYRWVAIDDLQKTVHPERLSLIKIVWADLKEMQEKAII